MSSTDVEKQQRPTIEFAENAEQITMVAPDEDGSGVPPGYWTSPRFLGSCVAIVLLANNLFIGYAMPVSRKPSLQ